MKKLSFFVALLAAVMLPTNSHFTQNSIEEQNGPAIVKVAIEPPIGPSSAKI